MSDRKMDIGKLVKDLSSDDADVRLRAIESLGDRMQEAKSTIPKIVRCIHRKSESSKFLQVAMRATLKIAPNDRMVLELIEDFLLKGEVREAEAAAKALMEIQIDALPFLVRGLLVTKSPFTWIFAAESLIRLKLPCDEAVVPLLNILNDQSRLAMRLEYWRENETAKDLVLDALKVIGTDDARVKKVLENL